MGAMFFFLVVVAVMFLSVVVQHFIPPVPGAGARVLLMPLVMFYGALAFPAAGMLALAFLGGLMWDSLHSQIIDGNIEIALGWSIVLYAALGAIMGGFRPLFQRGRWEVHCLLSGICTGIIVLAEYLMITFRREPVVFLLNKDIGWRIGGAAIVALLLSPFVFFGLNYLAFLVGYDPQPERRVKR
jgi:hypothetical protein